MSEKSIKFDRVKTVVKENVERVTDRIYWNGKLTLLAMGRFLDGTMPCTTHGTRDLLCKKIIELVDAADVRCVREIVSLVPKGADNRLPAWLYGPVETQLEDDGWTLRPAVAA